MGEMDLIRAVQENEQIALFDQMIKEELWQVKYHETKLNECRVRVEALRKAKECLNLPAS